MLAKRGKARFAARLGLSGRLVAGGIPISRLRQALVRNGTSSAVDFDFLKSSQVPVFIRSNRAPLELERPEETLCPRLCSRFCNRVPLLRTTFAWICELADAD
jgi:hypothetical protein